MLISLYPFRYYAMLPDYTLTTKIREESWKLDKLFPLLKTSKSELKRLIKGTKSNTADIPKIQHSIALSAAEIRTGIKDLKLINFYDSAILYLYFKLLGHILGLCSKEEERLLNEKNKAASKAIKLDNRHFEEIKKAKDEIEKKVRGYGGLIKGLDIAEEKLIEVYQKFVQRLDKLRWVAEKQAQEEFTFSKFTLRSMENLNRKMKVEAMKVKKLVPQKALLMRRIQRQVSHEDVVSLAKLVSEAIERIGKDISYSSKLISQFEDEKDELGAIVENLKKTINKNKKISLETAKGITKPWDDALKYLKEELHRDLMQIFRDIFVEYKYIATRKLAKREAA